MNFMKMLLPTFPLLLLLGCSNPAKDLPAAAVDPTSNSTTSAAAQPEPEGSYYVFGPSNAAIAFVGSKVTRSHNGGFRNLTGEFKVVNGRLANAGNKVVVDVTSLFADDARLTGHLKTPDFLAVAQFPTATFVSTAVDQKATNATVTGDLTLHGVTKGISFPANIDVSDAEVHVTAIFVLNRYDFEIKYPGMANDLIRKEVVLKLNVKAVPGRANFEAIEKAAQAAAAATPQMGRPPGGPRAGIRP